MREPFEGDAEYEEVEEEEENAGDEWPPVEEHKDQADGADTEESICQETREEFDEEVVTHPEVMK